MFKRWLSTAVLVCIGCQQALASDDFNAWKKQQEQDFQGYLNAQQSAFKASLEAQWQRFKLAQPKQLFSEPKIDEAPVSANAPNKLVDLSPKVNDNPNISAPQPASPTKTAPVKLPDKRKDVVTPSPQLIKKAPASTPPHSAATPNRLAISYLGQVYYLPHYTPRFTSLGANNQAIADAWESLYPDLTQMVGLLEQELSMYQLPDWALVSLLARYSKALAKGDENTQQLLFWALLLEMGFDARLAFDERYLYTLLASKQNVYGRLSMKLDDRHYYQLTGRTPQGALYTYSGSIGQKRRFDLAFNRSPPTTNLARATRTLLDTRSGLALDYYVYPALADYYRHHPSIELLWYFKAAPQGSNYSELVSTLRHALAEHPPQVQVRVLLSLVQFGFDYQKDQLQWGEEYYATPMHTLMLDAVDCEDRSFLFAYLVEQVVGLKTVGLKYPGHLAVAVAIDEQVMAKDADFVLVGAVKYFVSDPTYIGADIGQAMPMFAGMTPEVVNKHIAQ